MRDIFGIGGESCEEMCDGELEGLFFSQNAIFLPLT
jgi:hypothetical protein